MSQTPPRVLVVDDEADLRELLELTLIKMGLQVDLAESVETALAHLKHHHYQLVLTDMRLPDGQGLQIVRHVDAHCPRTQIAVMTAYGSADNAVVALKAGAFDYLTKPVALEPLRHMIKAALQGANIPAHTASILLGESPAMQQVKASIVRLAKSQAPVAITGESGSGKELAAREVHRQSARATATFVAVNCGAIPENLMEAEFFGAKKGAYTGADAERDGFFQAAKGGTLFLDEIAELPLSMQVKLLRVLQERRVRKLGGTADETTDVRIICATHQNLAQAVAEGRFRQDLFYRLNVLELYLPALRERSEDIAVLAHGILARLAEHAPAKALNSAALHALEQHHFAGNVRELENILERAQAFTEGTEIDVANLGLKGARVAENLPHVAKKALAREISLPLDLQDELDNVERELIKTALAKTQNNQTAAAPLLGVSFRQLRYRIARLGLK